MQVRGSRAAAAEQTAEIFAAIAKQRDADVGRVALAVRFECSEPNMTLCPAEVAWTTDDGRTLLIHLPQFDAKPIEPNASWPAATGV